MKAFDSRMGYKVNLRDFLKRLRTQRHLSFRELSRRTQPRVSSGYISLLEKGDQDRPSQSVVDSLLGVLEVSEKEAYIFKTIIRNKEIDSEVVDFYLSDPNIKVDDLGTLCFISGDDRNPNPKSSAYWWTALNALKDMADQCYEDWIRRVTKKS